MRCHRWSNIIGNKQVIEKKIGDEVNREEGERVK